MRSCPVLAALLVVAASVLLTATVSAENGRTYFSDDFDLADGDLRHDMWKVDKQSPVSSASIHNQTMRLYVKGTDRVVATPTFYTRDLPFTMEFLWMQENEVGNTLEVQILTSRDDIRYETVKWFFYSAHTEGWSVGDPMGYSWNSDEANAEVWEWYRVSITVKELNLRFLVTDDANSTTLFDREWRVNMDTYAMVSLGASADSLAISAARIDDLMIFDSDPSLIDPIQVEEVPPLVLEEDVPLTIDLGPYISDSDGNTSDIRIETPDDHVIDIQGFNVTLLCMEDGGRVDVRFACTDGSRLTYGFLELIITGVNDPPSVNLLLPKKNQTITDADELTIEYQITDPDSDSWETYWWVKDETRGYYDDREVSVRSSRYHLEKIGPLPRGSYEFGVWVSDGYERDTKTVLLVVVSSGTEPGSMTDPDTIGACLIGVFVITIIVGVVVMVVRSGRGTRYSQRELDAMSARRISRKGQDPGRSFGTGTGSRPPSPRSPMRQAPPPALAPARAEPPPAAYSTPAIGHIEDWRVSSVDEFMELIPQLPEGFPQPLWGIPQEVVGQQVVETSMMGPKGTPVCRVNGRLYNANKRDLSSFLQPAD